MTGARTPRSVAGIPSLRIEGDSMPTTIVIGSDGSAQSDAALRFGGALARALGARVIVATAYLHMPPLRGDGGAFERLARADAEEIARRGAATLEGVTDVQTEVPFGSSLGEALHRVANTEHADLLVVATSHRPRIAGHQLGSVAEQVVHHSPCPVAVVPPQDRELRFSRIGVAVDGTPGARAAIEFAYRLVDEAAGETRKLELLHVSPAPPHIPQPGLTRPAPEHALDREWLEEMAAEAAAYGEVDVVEATGDPAHELVRMSEGLDVLVTGSRDQGAVKRRMLGSVSTHTVHHAVCPVIVVPVRAADRGETTAAEHTTA
jgi:nucleotide-binding universal stress UspA family protein